ncbi:MAG TPA: hypothetical protein PKA41_08715 [Verrucomicrobiota bacterium]|nr:hypothetical protein [Verrucomicrobiota bacterium]
MTHFIDLHEAQRRRTLLSQRKSPKAAAPWALFVIGFATGVLLMAVAVQLIHSSSSSSSSSNQINQPTQ